MHTAPVLISNLGVVEFVCRRIYLRQHVLVLLHYQEELDVGLKLGNILCGCE